MIWDGMSLIVTSLYCSLEKARTYPSYIVNTMRVGALAMHGPSPWVAWQWRHNGCDSVSNHQHHDCFLYRLFRRKSKKTSKLRVAGLCVGNSRWPARTNGQWRGKCFHLMTSLWLWNCSTLLRIFHVRGINTWCVVVWDMPGACFIYMV